jgi:signal transduction histidine kinase
VTGRGRQGKPQTGGHSRWEWALRLTGLFALLFGVGGAAWAGSWELLGFFVPGFHLLPRGLAAFAAALTLLGLTFYLTGRVMGKRRPDFFGPFNDAVQRITRGDYAVTIPVKDHHQGGPGQSFNQLAENLNTMAGTLARMEALRRQFVADVSHEFQSPLTSILGFAQALQADLPAETRQRYLAIIADEARRLSRVSANLLKLNSLEDEEGPPDPLQFRVDTQLRRVIVALEPQWSAKGLTVEAALSEATVVGNEELWTQAWTNLLQNAVKFTPPGGRIAVRLAGPPPVVEVEDTGIGLTPDQAARVFERFYKADAARTGDTGSGLGLALVQRIAALHGARVEALSPGLGQGTTLKVSFGEVP